MAEASAQYAIDVAARMTGGNETLSQLDALTKNLLGGGKNAEFFQQATARVSRDLAAAAKAAADANQALADGTGVYRELEKASLRAEQAAEKAGKKNGGVIPEDFAARARSAAVELAGARDRMLGLESAAKAAGDRQAGFARTLANLGTLNAHVNKTILGQAEGLEKLRGGLAATGGPLGGLASKALAPVQSFAKLSGEMGAARAGALIAGVAIGALSVAALALVAAAAVAVVSVASWAVGLADTARSAGLASEAVVAMHPELAALSGTISELTGQTNLNAGQLQKLARDLKTAGVQAGDMAGALRAAAFAETALGNGGAAEFVADIKAGKASVSELAAETQAKLGGIVAKQMMGLDAQSARLKRGIGEIFGGLNIDPALSGMARIVALFDQSTVAGGALKFLFESVFQPLIDKADAASVVVEAFYLGVLIGATKLYIALKPAFKAASELFGFSDSTFASTLDTAKKAGELLAPVFIGLAAGVTLLAGLFAGALAVAIAIPVASMAIWVGVIYAVKAAFDLVAGAVTGAIGFIQSIDFAGIGLNIIQGIANGITGAAGALLNAIGGAVHGAIDHAKSILGISSPSKVFAQIGGYTAEGFAGGVEDGAPEAQAAVTAMAAPDLDAIGRAAASSGGAAGAVAAPAAAGAAKASGGGSSGGASGAMAAEFLRAMREFYSGEGAHDIASVLTRVLESDAEQVGA